jgi:AmpD protein
MTRKTPESFAQSALWQDGWYRFANRLDSPNFGPWPLAHPGAAPHAWPEISLIVVHSISLPPGQFGGRFIQQLFTNRLRYSHHPYFETLRNLKVSAHFLIERHGELWQFVSCLQQAWHAGASSFQGRANCNDFSIGIELEGLEGERFEQQQYETLSALCASLGQAYGPLSIAGHEHIAPERKQDPGPGFDWAVLQRQLDWPTQYFP